MTEPSDDELRVSDVTAVAMGIDSTPSGEVELVPVQLAFVDFYRHYRPQVAKALALTLGDLQLADEATDEAMTRAYQHWKKVSGLDNPGGWAYRVGLNWSRSVLRRRNRPERAPRAWDVDAPSGGEPSVIAALHTLSVDHRSVVVCRYLLGWTEEETAVALGVRRGTVKSRASRALSLLREQLHHFAPEVDR